MVLSAPAGVVVAQTPLGEVRELAGARPLVHRLASAGVPLAVRRGVGVAPQEAVGFEDSVAGVTAPGS